MNKRLWVVFGVIIAGIITLTILVATGVIGDGKTSDKISVEGFTWNEIIDDNNMPESYEGDKEIIKDHIEGNPDSDVVFIAWDNFQCSACYSLSPSIREIQSEYGDRVAFVHRYLYLTGHPNGLASSVAAEAAALQGKYREMADLLFINSYAGDSWKDAGVNDRENIFASYAQSIGLDVEKWREDYNNYETNGIKARLNFQNDLGIENGVNGSPYILVNGTRVNNAKDDIAEALDTALGI